MNLATLQIETLSQWQQAADYQATCKRLRPNGLYALLLGAMVWLLATFTFAGTALYPFIMAVAIALGLQGIMLVALPGRIALSAGVIVALLTGGMLFGSAWWLLSHAQGSGALPIAICLLAGGWQLLQGGRYLTGYRENASVLSAPPPHGRREMLEDIYRQLWHNEAREALVTFTVTTVLPRQRWRGRLLNGYAVFAQQDGAEMLFLPCDAIRIEPQKSESVFALPEQVVAVSCHLADHHWQGLMMHDDYLRYRAWQLRQVV